METVKEILNQLGGNKFVVMTGAHTILKHDDNTLSLKFRGSRRANYLKVQYIPSIDLYTVTIGKIGAKTYKVISQTEGVYNDMLQELFTRVTGLYTSL